MKNELGTKLMNYINNGDTTNALLIINSLNDSRSTNNANTELDTSPLIKEDEDVVINTKDANEKTALILAVEKGNKEIVKALVKAGANLNTQDNNGATALIWASAFGHKEIVTDLITDRTDLNAQGKDGTTALMYASEMVIKK